VGVPDNLFPLNETTMQLLNDSALARQAAIPAIPWEQSFKEAVDSVRQLEKAGKDKWYLAKNTSVKHLAKLPAFGFERIKIGGWSNTINAAKDDHGPSWKMVVELGKNIRAFGIYPGGQSGNPGSRYYADYLDKWSEGKYFPIEFLPNLPEQNEHLIKYTIIFHP
jgi:penicillin amidase